MTVSGAAGELCRTDLFRGVDPPALAALDEVAFVRRLARGQVLFVEGEPADHLVLIRAGSLKVHLVSAQGSDLLLALLGPGAVLGDVSLIDAGPRSAGATALTDAELLAVPSDAVRAVLRSRPDALWAVAVSLAAGVRRLTGRAADLVFLDLPRRLAKLLLDSQVAGVVDLPVTQTDLAAMLGVSRQSLNKGLSGFVSRGWVELGEGTVRLLDPDALERLARS
ncbi:Crp/Fnr family transcriptional regulator [Jatrophihabitans fulvus]